MPQQHALKVNIMNYFRVNLCLCFKRVLVQMSLICMKIEPVSTTGFAWRLVLTEKQTAFRKMVWFFYHTAQIVARSLAHFYLNKRTDT